MVLFNKVQGIISLTQEVEDYFHTEFLSVLKSLDISNIAMSMSMKRATYKCQLLGYKSRCLRLKLTRLQMLKA